MLWNVKYSKLVFPRPAEDLKYSNKRSYLKTIWKCVFYSSFLYVRQWKGLFCLLTHKSPCVRSLWLSQLICLFHPLLIVGCTRARTVTISLAKINWRGIHYFGLLCTTSHCCLLYFSFSVVRLWRVLIYERQGKRERIYYITFAWADRSSCDWTLGWSSYE